MPKPARSQSGFTLIEILLSIFLMGIMFIIFQTAITTSQLNRRIKNQEIGLRAAQSEIEVLRSGGYTAIPASGTFTNTALSRLPGGLGTITVTIVNAKTKQIVAAVFWKEAGRPVTSSVALTTLITEGGL